MLPSLESSLPSADLEVRGVNEPEQILSDDYEARHDSLPSLLSLNQMQEVRKTINIFK